ncbi:ABC transporter ATP-binding protein [Burkholderia sp. Ac-20353]|uniref:ABC transporter ATP-binding protein n=1 Tax=Burkholderia sp. Ac-20353 TaxID=2703894 RepID=UPI00197C35A4|nr:ABC transporter ATP-binding protein [Burkholderia sp. Ac-20353]MBN3789101.1 ABC transporter ATP-binding protein [Burkholderia sp. Ac-20353]
MKRWIGTYSEIGRHLQRRERFFIVAILSCTLGSATSMAMSPVILGRLTDILLAADRRTSAYVIYLAVSYLIAIAMPRFLGTVDLYLQSMLRLRANRSLLASYFNYLCRQPDNFFVNKNSGELTQEITQASNDLYLVIRNLSTSLISPIVQICIAVVVLASNQDLLVAGTIAIYVVLFVTNNVIHGRRLVELKSRCMDAGKKSYATLTDSITNIHVARQFDGYHFLLSRYQRVLDEDRHTQGYYWKISLRMQFFNACLFVGLFGVTFLMALHEVVTGARSVGNFVLVAAYTVTLLSPIEILGNMFTEINQSLVTFGRFLDRLSTAMNPVSRLDRNPVSQPAAPAIEFERVCVTYPGAGRRALTDIGFTVDSGQRVAITGPSGAGKSTLVKVLTKQLVAEGGAIRIFGEDILCIDAQTLRERIGCVSQDVFLFKDTLRFNLQISRPDASDADMIAALECAGLKDLLIGLPAGLDTTLGDRGATLSGGQRQRLALARLFLRAPDIVLVDEGTSSLDLVTEQYVLDKIFEIFSGKTIVMITHRPSAMTKVDAVIVMSDGQIDDYAEPDVLRSRNTFFARVIESVGH